MPKYRPEIDIEYMQTNRLTRLFQALGLDDDDEGYFTQSTNEAEVIYWNDLILTHNFEHNDYSMSTREDGTLLVQSRSLQLFTIEFVKYLAIIASKNVLKQERDAINLIEAEKPENAKYVNFNKKG